jgi:hypothetical protein
MVKPTDFMHHRASKQATVQMKRGLVIEKERSTERTQIGGARRTAPPDFLSISKHLKPANHKVGLTTVPLNRLISFSKSISRKFVIRVQDGDICSLYLA